MTVTTTDATHTTHFQGNVFNHIYSNSHLERDTVFGHDEREHGEAEDLRGVGLGRCHADLWPGVDVHAAVRLAGDCRT